MTSSKNLDSSSIQDLAYNPVEWISITSWIIYINLVKIEPKIKKSCLSKGTSSKNLNLLQKHVNRMLTPRVRPPSPPGQTLSWWAKHCNHTTGTCSYRASMQNACFHYQVVHNKNISYPQSWNKLKVQFLLRYGKYHI